MANDPSRSQPKEIRKVDGKSPSDTHQRSKGRVRTSSFYPANVRWLDAITLRGFLDRPPSLLAMFAQAATKSDDDTTKDLRLAVVSGLQPGITGRWHNHSRILPPVGR